VRHWHPRLRVAERRQIEFRACCWDDLLSDDHEARMVWQYVASLDLTPAFGRGSRPSKGGRPSADRSADFGALWLYATLRELGADENWRGAVNRTCRFSGFAAACRLITTRWQTSAWRMSSCSTAG